MRFENILNRNFQSERVNEKWVSDIIYIRVQQGWIYLTTILDLADRMFVNRALSNDMSARKTIMGAFNLENACIFRPARRNFRCRSVAFLTQGRNYPNSAILPTFKREQLNFEG